MVHQYIIHHYLIHHYIFRGPASRLLRDSIGAVMIMPCSVNSPTSAAAAPHSARSIRHQDLARRIEAETPGLKIAINWMYKTLLTLYRAYITLFDTI